MVYFSEKSRLAVWFQLRMMKIDLLKWTGTVSNENVERENDATHTSGLSGTASSLRRLFGFINWYSLILRKLSLHNYVIMNLLNFYNVFTCISCFFRVSWGKGVKFQSFTSLNLPNILSFRITLNNAVWITMVILFIN